jgi:hypothetical protein
MQCQLLSININPIALEPKVSPSARQDYNRAQHIMYEPLLVMVIEELQETLFPSQLLINQYWYKIIIYSSSKILQL